MATLSSRSINGWIRRKQCPCGDWKCYIRYDEDREDTSMFSQGTEDLNSQSGMNQESAEADFIPYVGQTFKSDDDAFEYYRNFARKNGFSIRKARSRGSQTLGVYRRDFVCHRAGFAQSRKKAELEHQRDRKSSRCKCDAKMFLLKEIVDDVPAWTVVQFSNIHNHELLEDDLVRLLPAYRKIQASDQERIFLLYKAGFSVSRIMKALELEKGADAGQLPFMVRDVTNFIQSRKKIDQQHDALLTEKREVDVSELLEACKSMKERDADFIYDFTVNENNKLENIAWAYGSSIIAYDVFGDVIIFDTTYYLVTYETLLGVWFGVDNHGKTIVFGCVLLQEEAPHSFTWALQTFVRFMKGKRPHTMVTDLDLALKDVVTSELPNTKLVFSIRHILSKLSSWFSLLLESKYEEFKSEFGRLYSLENLQDFEYQWNHMVHQFGLNLDRHIDLLFSHRASWALCYIRGYFLAKMSTTSYTASIDAFLKGILSTQTCLKSLFEQVATAADFRREAGEKLMQDVHIKTPMPIEEHASNILTPYAFDLLQQEIILSMQYATFEMSNGSYLVRHHKKTDGGCLVNWTPDDEVVDCSCQEFDFSGILCRHALRVLTLKNCFQLPEKYLLTRWCRGSSLSSKDDQINQINDNDLFEAFKSQTENLFTESSVSKERAEYVQKQLTRVLNHVRRMPGTDGGSLNFAPEPLASARIEDATNDS